MTQEQQNELLLHRIRDLEDTFEDLFVELTNAETLAGLRESVRAVRGIVQDRRDAYNERVLVIAHETHPNAQLVEAHEAGCHEHDEIHPRIPCVCAAEGRLDVTHEPGCPVVVELVK